MATTIPAQRAWTYADLDDLPDDDCLYEIVGGNCLCATRRMTITQSCWPVVRIFRRVRDPEPGL